MELVWDTGGDSGGVVFLIILLAFAFGALLYLSQQNGLASTRARRKHELLTSSLGVIEPPPVAEPVPPQVEVPRKTRIITEPAEKRKALRRVGNPIPILLSFSGNPAEAVPAMVVDRSTGGLGVLASRSAEMGTLIQVRPVDAPEDVPWFTLEVRHARPKGGQWFLGMKFEKKLPWGQLLYFG